MGHCRHGLPAGNSETVAGPSEPCDSLDFAPIPRQASAGKGCGAQSCDAEGNCEDRHRPTHRKKPQA